MKVFIAAALLLFFRTVSAQDIYENKGYLCSSVSLGSSVVTTNNFGSALYLINGEHIRIIASSPGCGNGFTFSKGKGLIGFKSISQDARQTPALYDLSTNNVRHLPVRSELCGQISFSSAGDIAYTDNTTLRVIHSDSTSAEYELGYYSNTTPVSPDGNFAAFNDERDRIWILNLRTGEKFCTNNGTGFCRPQWSPAGDKLLFSSMNGYLFIFDLQTKLATEIGEGYSPSFSTDGRSLCYYKKEFNGSILANTDIYTYIIESRSVRRLTNTPGKFEIDPSYTDDGGILFTLLDKPEIQKAIAGEDTEGLTIVSGSVFEDMEIKPAVPPAQAKGTTGLDIPYVNQVYDTPDWWNGHSSCGPTTSVMLLAYYNILPKWDGYCSTPTAHYNSYGRYVADKYRYKEMIFNATANDPNGTAGYGAFGYMWGSGSPRTRMSYYYYSHGSSSQTFDNPDHSVTLSEINAGYPLSLCNGLTTAGHIILGHGFGSEQHTILFNDPYGNKNNPGYPNYTGKNSYYDWPGYSNGFQNLKTAYWYANARFSKQTTSDSLIDDMQFDNGFYLHTKSPASMMAYSDNNSGYAGHHWLANTRLASDTCYVEWRPALSKSGFFEVFAAIPALTPTATSAKYKVNHADGMNIIEISQQANAGGWVSLGTFRFESGTAGFVRLGDATGESGKMIAFDAMKWDYKGPASSVQNSLMPVKAELMQNYPNPFNPSTVIRYQTPKAGLVSLRVYDVLGRLICEPVNEFKAQGYHSTALNMDGLPGGIYIGVLTAGNQRSVIKMSLLK